jgi:guanidinopropionase
MPLTCAGTNRNQLNKTKKRMLDPAFAPGTGTPEIGGLASWQVQAILRRLHGIQFVGMDLVEVAPAYDVAEITALAGATVVWEYICLLGLPL